MVRSFRRAAVTGDAVVPATDGPPSLAAGGAETVIGIPGPGETAAEAEMREALGPLRGEPALIGGAEASGSAHDGVLVTRAALRRRPDGLRQHAEADQAQTEGGKPSAPPLDDAAVELLKKGHPASWEAAYLAYGRALMGYLVLRLHNHEDAADALSETFARAIDKASAFRGDSYAFRAWLFSIARNVSTDQHRMRSRVVVLGEQPEGEDRHQPSGEDIAILKEDVAELRRGFAKLAPAEQEILWLRVCAGLPAAEVGQVLGKKPGTVRMQQLRALQSLRVQVGP